MANKAQYIAATTAFTGSISKIYCPAATNITSWAFGDNTNPYTTFTSTSTTIAIIAGSYVEGPIVQYKASVPTIAYTT